MSEESEEEKLHTHLTQISRMRMGQICTELDHIRTECQEIYVQTGNDLAKKICDFIEGVCGQ